MILPRNYQQNWLKPRFQALNPRVSDADWGGVREFALLTSSAMLVLLLWGPHRESHCTRLGINLGHARNHLGN